MPEATELQLIFSLIRLTIHFVSLFTFLELFDGLGVGPLEVQVWSHHPFTSGGTPSKHRGIL